MPYADMRDEELANDLAVKLSDFEFELLLRKRIEMQFAVHLSANMNIDEGQSYCSFSYKWDDRCTWEIALGGSYRDRVHLTGEVLSISLNDCHEMWKRQNRNKLSLLLPK